MDNEARLFDVYIAVDWSARNVPSSPKPVHDALWVGERDIIDKQDKETYWRTRYECIKYLDTVLVNNVRQNKRVIIGYDLDFGFPAGFISTLDMPGAEPKWQKMWSKLCHLIEDDKTNANNRFEVASKLNALCMGNQLENIGPFWGCPLNKMSKSLYYKSPKYPFITKNGQVLKKSRWTETLEPKAQPVWKLIGSGSVGGQTLVGIPAVARLRYNPSLTAISKIWPFETGFNVVKIPFGVPFVLHVEIWPGILSGKLDPTIAIRDQAQVRASVQWISECDETGLLMQLLGPPKNLSETAQQECVEEEGWVLGSGLSREPVTSIQNTQLALF